MYTAIHGSLIPVLLRAVAGAIEKRLPTCDVEYIFDETEEELRVININTGEILLTEPY